MHHAGWYDNEKAPPQGENTLSLPSHGVGWDSYIVDGAAELLCME